MVEKAATIWADGPSSAPDRPAKPLIREWGTWLEGFISAIGENSGTIFETKAQMDAALAYDANTMAWVVDDADVANNGVYRKIGASGSGSWARVADLPYSYVTVVDDGTSTANAMSMETTLPVGFGSMIAIKVPLTNTSSTVTISFNGSTAIPVKTASGGLPPVGTLIQNMVCLGFVNDVDNVFQLMTDVASAAIQTAAAASASAASTSATNAATSATLAQDWATKAEDVPVTGSLYSAYHWAQKAASYVTGSIAAAIHGATSKSAPTALDEFAIADSAASWGLKKVTAESVMSGPQGYIYGLAMTTNATDAANDIDFAAGVATSDTAPYYRMTASAMTKRLDATFTVGTGNGMLDTGTVANGTYYLFEIQRSDTLVTDFLASTSASAPTMPTNYDRKRLIGSLVRSGGVNATPTTTSEQESVKAWVRFYWNGTSVSVLASKNVSSVVRNAAGDYTVNFASALGDGNYALAGAVSQIPGDINLVPAFYTTSGSGYRPSTFASASSCRVAFQNRSGGWSDPYYEASLIFVR